jgi:glycosyltransferase involved in cell wall biosynthesis
MRIALVAPHVTLPGSPSADGEPRVTNLAQALGGLGHQVTVYGPTDSPDPARRVKLGPRVTVEHVPVGTAGALAGQEDLGPHIREFGDYLARRWRASRPDLAHAHFWPSGLASLAGARDLGIPVVQTFHLVRAKPRKRPDRRPRELARMRVKASLAREVDAVLAGTSEEMRELARLGVPRAGIQVVPAGVDTGEFAPEGPVAKRNGRRRLLTVGPLTAEQGVDIVIRSLAEVPDAELVVAGGPARGKLRQDVVYQHLAGLARELGVASRVTFTGSVSPGELPALLRSADMLVSAAWDEPFGTVALQAMACGKPVVASAVGIYPDAVIDGTTGALVPPGHPSLLARRVRNLLSSPLQLEAFGIAAADRARARYSWERIGQETARAYERCLAISRGQNTPADPGEPALAAARADDDADDPVD